MFRRVRIVDLARSLIFLSLFSMSLPDIHPQTSRRTMTLNRSPPQLPTDLRPLPSDLRRFSIDPKSRPLLPPNPRQLSNLLTRALRLLLPLPNQRISHTMLQGRPPLPPSRTGNDDSNRSPSPSRLPALTGEKPMLLMGLIKLRSPRWWVEPVPPLEHRGEDQTRRTKLIETLPLLSPLSRPKLSEKHSSSRSRWISITSQLPSDCLSSRIRFVLPPDSSPCSRADSSRSSSFLQNVALELENERLVLSNRRIREDSEAALTEEK